jgi:hypothetical protein
MELRYRDLFVCFLIMVTFTSAGYILISSVCICISSCYLLYVFSSIVLALSVEHGFLPFVNVQKDQIRQGRWKHSPSHLPLEYCHSLQRAVSYSRQERWGRTAHRTSLARGIPTRKEWLLRSNGHPRSIALALKGASSNSK